MSWHRQRLGELGSFKNGVNFTKDAVGSGRPFINVKDVTGSHRFSHRQLDLVRLDVGADSLASPNDLFFVRSSVKLDGIGLVGRLSGDLPEDGVLHCGFVIRFRPDSNLIDSDFLMYLLLTPYFRQCLKNLSGGAAIINISQQALKTLEVPLPTLIEQQKIAGIIRGYDDLIENNRRRIQLLEQAARLLYKEWFVHLRFPGHEHVKITNGVPDGWKKTDLQTACISGNGIQTGPFGSQLHQHEYTDIGHLVVMPKDVVGDRIDVSTIAREPDEIQDRLSRHVLEVGEGGFAVCGYQTASSGVT